MNFMKKFNWGYLLLIPGLGFILFFIVIVCYKMIAQSIGFYNYTGESYFTLKYWMGIWDQTLFDDLWFTFWMAFMTATVSLILTYLLCFILQKTPGKKTFLSLFKVPLFVPGLVAAFLITNVIDYQGLLNLVLQGLHIIEEPLRLRNDDAGIGCLIVNVWKNVPFQLLILYSAVDSVRKDIKDAALNLGATKIALALKIVIPISFPSAMSAYLMSFIRTFNDYAVAKTTGPLYPTTLTNLMYLQAYSFSDWNSAACIGVLMIIAAFVFVIAYTYVTKKIMQYT